MPRNLDRRVEALVPVDDPTLRERIDEILEVNLLDERLAWTLHDDRWSPPSGDGDRETHVILQERARALTGERA
jgi:polyphosphate kinase